MVVCRWWFACGFVLLVCFVLGCVRLLCVWVLWVCFGFGVLLEAWVALVWFIVFLPVFDCGYVLLWAI